MRKKKWTLFSFPTGDFKGVERYLNEQAARGWELEKTGLLLGRWRRTDRADLTWCVDLVDPRQEREDKEDYLALCAEGGWELAFMTNRMYLFKSMAGQEPIPVQTDAELERKNYNRYYIKELILSAVILLAYLGFYTLMFWATPYSRIGDIQLLRYQWFDSWMATTVLIGLPVWGLCALWKLVSFGAAQIRNRGGQIAAPPRWMLWADCGAGALVWVVLLLFFVSVALDIILTGSNNVALYVLLGIDGLYALYQALLVERELFPRERRRAVAMGLGLLVVMAGLIAAAVNSPYQTWSSYHYGNESDAEKEDALARYAQTETVPLVRTEDLGLPLQEPGSGGEGFFELTHTITPAGDHWQVENYYWGSGVRLTGCETYTCSFEWQATLLVRSKVEEIIWWADNDHRQAVSGSTRLNAPPAVELVPVSLTWADEAWYGEQYSQEEGSTVSVLVLRKGTLVCRLSAPVPLMTEELLPVIQARLGL